MELTEQEEQAYFRLSEAQETNPIWKEMFAELAANFPKGYGMDGDGRVFPLDPSLPEYPEEWPNGDL